MHPVETLLNLQVTEAHTPSVQYIHFDTRKILFRHTAGLANLSTGQAPNCDTLYQGYSVTKTFTAIAILQLAEKGALHLSDALTKYLPDLPYSSAITLRHLLHHSAGIPNPMPLNWIHLPEEHATFDEWGFFRPVLQKNGKPGAAPDEKFAYSNLGYVLLGEVIALVSGMSYADYIEQHILQKLPLPPDSIGFHLAGHERSAVGYQKYFSVMNAALGLLMNKRKFMQPRIGGWQPFRPLYVNGSAYGGLFGTPEAFVTYVQALLEPDGRLLSGRSRMEMLTENRLSDGKESGMSMSWFCGELHGIPFRAHAGGGGGFYVEIRLYPTLQKGSVVFFNRTGISDERFLDKVDRYMLD
ncbi:MAG: beta-lactamase family protein [Saprospiraceae bacterium]|nr:beta-lactamase family protein [Saprospiraceae bacterium]